MLRRRVVCLLSVLFVASVSLFGSSHVGLSSSLVEVAPNPGVWATPRTLDDVFAEVAHVVPEFAGAVADESSGHLLVLLTRPSPELAVRAYELLAERGQVAPSSAAQVTAMPADYGFLQLKEWYDQIAPDILALPGVVMTDIDEARNRLRIGVADMGHEVAVRQVAGDSLVPQAAMLVERMEPVRQQDLRDLHRPLLGGLQIGAPFICTLGFVAERAGDTGFVTNAHCTGRQGFTDGDLAGQPNMAVVVGVEAFDPLMFTSANDGNCPTGRRCRYSDAAFISTLAQVPVARGWVARAADGSPAWDHSARYSIDRKGDAFAGATVEKIGRTTGLTRGQVSTTCAHVRALNPDGSDTGITMLCQWIAGLRSAGGDSGSPVVAFEAGTNRTLRGILWGGDGTTAVFSTIGLVEDVRTELGPLTVCVVSTC